VPGVEVQFLQLTIQVFDLNELVVLVDRVPANAATGGIA
jgi:hypothetical protein